MSRHWVAQRNNLDSISTLYREMCGAQYVLEVFHCISNARPVHKHDGLAFDMQLSILFRCATQCLDTG